MTPDIKRRKTQLEDRLAVLEARIAEIGEELESHVTRDWEELAVEREEDEVLETMGLSAQAELRQIRAALGRIERGDYGICMRCGGEIGAERLDVLPFTPFCRTCAT